MSKKRLRGLDEFRTVHLNLTDEEFDFLRGLCAFSEHPLGREIAKKCTKALKFFRARNNAIKQRKAAFEKYQKETQIKQETL